MTRSELIAILLQKHPYLQVREATRLVNTVFGGIARSLANGQRVELRGVRGFFSQGT
jgi:integration host factor subunit beta